MHATLRRQGLNNLDLSAYRPKRFSRPVSRSIECAGPAPSGDRLYTCKYAALHRSTPYSSKSSVPRLLTAALPGIKGESWSSSCRQNRHVIKSHMSQSTRRTRARGIAHALCGARGAHQVIRTSEVSYRRTTSMHCTPVPSLLALEPL